MKNFSFVMVVIFMCLSGITSAQSSAEILRYNSYQTYGSARYMGLSGAMNGIGADLSLVNQNPASWGGFWKSEFALTADFNTISSDSYYEVEPTRTSSTAKTSFLLPQVGYVYTSTNLNGKNKAWSFGIGYNQLANFSSEFNIIGDNAGSISEYWLAKADGKSLDDLDDFQEGLAYDANVLFTDGDFYAVDYEATPDAPLSKSQTSNTKGSNGEIYIGGGGNIQNKWLWGVTMGLPIYRFRQDKYYIETDERDEVPAFQRLRFDEYLRTSGAGFNAKAGIMRKFDNFRISGAVHSPTWYNLREDYETNLDFAYVLDGNYDESQEYSPNGMTTYGIKTPWRFMLAAGYLLGKSGFIDGEFEYVDHSQSRFSINDDSYDPILNANLENQLNDEIQTLYGSTFNVKIGGEFVVAENWRVRGGFRLDSQPLKQNSEYNNSYSLGVGYRGNRFYIDAAWVQRNTNEDYLVYPLVGYNEPLVKQKFRSSNLGVTFGFKL